MELLAGRVTDMQTMMQTPRRAPETELQKVVVVNGSPEILEMLETVLDAGRYDMVFVESSARAYSRVRHVQPDLVIVCMRIDDAEVFQLLSMLKLDTETRRIPVVTYTTHLEAESDEPENDVIEEDDFPITRPTMMMN
jgi:CheY-like chemotaxis protein